MNEHQANLDLAPKQAPSWQAPAPQRRRNDPTQRAARRVDAVLVLMLACTVAALAFGML